MIDAISLFLVALFASFAVPTGAIFFLMYYSALAKSSEELLFIIFLVFLAASLGDILAYFFAKIFHKKIDFEIKKHRWLSKREEKVEKFFDKHGFKSLFLTKFLVVGLGPPFNYYAGLKKIRLKIFIPAVIFGEIFYASIYSYLAYFYRETWQDILNLTVDLFAIATILAILIVLVRHLIKDDY